MRIEYERRFKDFLDEGMDEEEKFLTLFKNANHVEYLSNPKEFGFYADDEFENGIE